MQEKRKFAHMNLNSVRNRVMMRIVIKIKRIKNKKMKYRKFKLKKKRKMI